MSGTLFIVSAPSGAGKSSLLQALLRKHDDASMKISVSTTTRAPRPGEEDGVHYHFVSTDEFKNQIAAGDFYEWAQVFDNYYGTSKRVIEQQLAQGIDVFLDIDWQGARQIREQVPSAKSIFILPPSVAELHNRLTGRGQDSADVIAKRMLQAKSEMSHYDEYDYLIINDNFDQALNELNCIVYAQRQALTHQQQRFGDLIADLLA